MSNLIVFDLDGVITSEAAYWDAAGLTLYELMYSPHYWNLAGGNVGATHSALQFTAPYQSPSTAALSRSISRAIFPETEILALKARSINSNWDTTYAAVCLRLIDLLARLPASSLSTLLPPRPWEAGWIAAFRRCTAHELPRQAWQAAPFHLLDALNSPLFQGYAGLDLINRFDTYASEKLDQPISGVFSRYSPFWEFCRDLFQQWFLGDKLYARTYGHAPANPGKPGCIHFEQPLLPLEQIQATLETLRRQGYMLGIATGRDRQEALYPLKQYGLLSYFDERRISTYDDVERAEVQLRARGDRTLLTKPHPFPYLLAAASVGAREAGWVRGGPLWSPAGGSAASFGPSESREATNDVAGYEANHPTFIVVGDATSDMLAGRAAGAITVAVLTGARTTEARERLAQSDPDFTIGDITQLPALLEEIDSLATIQRLQFSEKEKAERLLRRWFDRHMHLSVEHVTLAPKAVSLNSFNGFYRSAGEDFFFKTHVEEEGTIEEYYNAERLRQAGYNIVQPLRTLHEGGRQMVIYPVIRWPVMFDLVRAIETNTKNITSEMLAAAEREECARLLDIYRATLQLSTEEEHAQAPIHQLFWHRLAGARMKSFYIGKQIMLPGNDGNMPFDALLQYRWNINGVPQQHTLGELIERAKNVLRPGRAAMTIIGHGDAHFGNVFLEDRRRYLYFDPAFAGRHTPLLDVVKPLFHNIFATWMYFPREVARDLRLSLSINDEADRGLFRGGRETEGHPQGPSHISSEQSQEGHPQGSPGHPPPPVSLQRPGIGSGELSRVSPGISREVSLDHNYTLTPVREAILRAKVEHLLRPLIAELAARDALPADWREIVQLALMCCALLTVNLVDRQRFPPIVSWLGLSLAVQVGNNGIRPWGFEL